MVEADFSGIYVNSENVKAGDIGEIANEGSYVEITTQAGKKRTVLNLPVRINGKELIFTPNNDNGKRLVKAFGKDTKEWIGKKIQASVVNYKSFGQTKQAVEFEPLVAKKI